MKTLYIDIDTLYNSKVLYNVGNGTNAPAKLKIEFI